MYADLSKVKLACCQLAPRIGDMAYNRQLTEQAIREAASAGAQIIVLPELIQSGYQFRDQAEAWAYSEYRDGPSVSLWQQLAQTLGVVIVAGFCERLEQHQVANSAALLMPEGAAVIYQKVHLWDQENQIFCAGDQAPPVVETPFGRLAMMICYDLEFPEWVRLPALAGAELLCAPVNWPAHRIPQGERPPEVVKAQANAAVNRLPLAVCDRYGTERGVDWLGASVIVDADGYPQAGPAAPAAALLLAELDLSLSRNKQISQNNHVHDDRRPALYQGILKR